LNDERHMEKKIPPAYLLPWLTYTDFLTEKLRSLTGNAVLQVLANRWEPPSDWDKNRLGVTSTEILNREICMKSHDEVCWFARTVLPIETFNSAPDLFNRLKKEPLGNLIFHGSDITRSSHTYYPIDNHAAEYHWLDNSIPQEVTCLWVRSSEFKVHGRFSFYLIEILLPGLERVL